MKLGLIQTRGLGDIVIALPAAQALIAEGHEIYWPVDKLWIPDFAEAEPAVRWLPVLQGWVEADYLRHVDAYGRAGVLIAAPAYVGVRASALNPVAAYAQEPAVEIVPALPPLAHSVEMTCIAPPENPRYATVSKISLKIS